MVRLIWLACLLMSLAACSWFQNNPEENRKAMCKELKHRIIFNAATPNQIVATQERAETATLHRSYREDDCK